MVTEKRRETKIYTHDEAAKILEMFDELLADNNIKVPSPEDYERDEDNEAALYGSTYSDLFDSVENLLIDMLDKQSKGFSVVANEFSGDF